MTKRRAVNVVASVVGGVLSLVACLFVLDASSLEKWLAFPVGAVTVFVLNWGLEKAFDRDHRAPQARSIPDDRKSKS